MNVSLTVVGKNEPEPPYPANTKAGSFTLDLEVDRLAASDTWILVEPDIRPWALMTWVMSWQQVPCGSWPYNDDVIAARIGCDRKFFQLHRDEIMRGWRCHSDGRWYHKVVTEKVLAFLETREKWKSKDKNRRLAKQALRNKLSGESQETPPRLPADSPPSSSSSSSLKTSPNGEESTAFAVRPPNCPHEKIKNLYHEILPGLPGIRVWDSTDRRNLAAFWKNNPDLDWFQGYFQHVAETPFLLGKNDRGWRADLRWLIKPANFKKVFEGKYNGL